MKTHEFKIIIDAYSLDDLPESVSDALFEAGCDDATQSSSCGVTSLAFHRESASMDDAITSATRDVVAGLRAGGSPHRVTRVEPYDETATEEDLRAIERSNAGLSTAHSTTAGAMGADRGS